MSQPAYRGVWHEHGGTTGFVKPLAAVGTKVMLGVSDTAMSRCIRVCDSAYQFA